MSVAARPAGDTIYNLSRFNELEVDEQDRPAHPPVLNRADVLWNPFDDLKPRVDRCVRGEGWAGRHHIKQRGQTWSAGSWRVHRHWLPGLGRRRRCRRHALRHVLRPAGTVDWHPCSFHLAAAAGLHTVACF